MTTTNPFAEALGNYGRDRFVGRTNILNLARTRYKLKGVAVSGLKGMGKTSLLRRIQAETEDVCVFVDAFGLKPAQLMLAMVEELERETLRLAREAREGRTEPPVDWASLPEDVPARIKQALRALSDNGHKVILLLDDVDDAIKDMTRELEGYFRDYISHSILVMTTTWPLLTIQPEWSPSTNSTLITRVTQERLMPFSLAERKALLRGPESEPPLFSETEEAFLDRAAGGNPLLLTTAASFLLEAKAAAPDLVQKWPPTPGVDRERFELKLRRQMVVQSPDLAHLLDDYWSSLPDEATTALLRLAVGDTIAEKTEDQLRTLGLIVPGKLHPEMFSAAFADFVREHLPVPPHEDYERILPRIGKKDEKVWDLLFHRPNQIVSEEALYEAGWDGQVKPRALEASLYRIRKALRDEDDGSWEYIQLEPGKGYVYRPKRLAAGEKN